MPTQEQNFHNANQENSRPDLVLMEFWEIGSNIRDRCVANNEDIVSQGNTYTQAKFSFQIPNSGNDISSVNITITNIDLTAGRAVAGAKLRIQCRLIVASGLNYDNWIFDSEDMFVVTETSTNQVQVSGELSMKADALMPYPFGQTGEREFPGLYL